MAPQHRESTHPSPQLPQLPQLPRLRRALTLGAVTGAGSAVQFWKIPRRPLMTVTGVVAASVTTAGVILARDQAEREARVQGEEVSETGLARRIGAPVLTGIAVGSVVAGSMWLSSVTDHWTEKAIGRLGAKRPRATLAVVAGIGTAVLEYLDPSTRHGTAQDGHRTGTGRRKGVESPSKH
ncbi:hypothetical protein [Citricoccus sp. GCM10030269]|uniref:hypothetical protein n=1 Tax=Citricoccus sp. GCM10030269 TaxID=3273388 RepID=UPI00360F47B9